MRTHVAVLPLQGFVGQYIVNLCVITLLKKMKGGGGETHMAAKLKIPMTIPFVLLDMFRFLTMKIGSVPKVQSATALMAEAAYVASTMILGSRQPFLSRVHQAEMGLHWNKTSRS